MIEKLLEIHKIRLNLAKILQNGLKSAKIPPKIG